MNAPSQLQEKVYLLAVTVTVISEVIRRGGIFEVFDEFDDGKVLKIIARGASFHEYLRSQPPAKMCGKTGVCEVEFGRFGKAFQLVVGIRLQQKDYVQPHQKIKPCLCRGHGDVRRTRNGRDIELAGVEGGAGGDEFAEAQFVPDRGHGQHIAHQIGVDIRIVIGLMLRRRRVLDLRHAASPNRLKDRWQIEGRGEPFPFNERVHFKTYGRGKAHARHLAQRQRIKRHDADPAGERFLNVAHQGELFRAGQPKKPCLVRAVASDLDIGKQFGRLLHFVDDDGRLVALQEHLGVGLGKFEFAPVVQRHVGAISAQLFEHGGLSHLPCARDQDRLEKGAHLKKLVFEMTLDIHSFALQSDDNLKVHFHFIVKTHMCQEV